MYNLYDYSLMPGMTTDLIGPENNPMYMYMGCGYPYMGYGGYNTNLLGGVTMPQSLYRDMYTGPKIDQARNISGFKNGLLATVAIVGGSIVLGKFGKLFKSIGKAFSKTPKVP